MKTTEQRRAGSHGIFKAVVLLSDSAGGGDSRALNRALLMRIK